MLARFFENCHSLEIAGKIRGVVAPHAGYQYSGAVAANAFAHLQGHHATIIVVLGPYHDYHPASFLTSAHQAYHTPFGVVEIHRELLEALDSKLRAQLGEGLTLVEHDREHSVENQLPFLQYLFGDFHLLPIMLRTRNACILQSVGHNLAQILSGEEALFVASSDLSHFYRQERALQFDAEILRRMEAFDPARVLSTESEGVGYACGAGAIAATLWGTREMGADRVTMAGYDTSGDVSGDDARVVGYGSAVVWQQEKGSENTATGVAKKSHSEKRVGK
jgi:AmmeMemoRadiSam system protein B